MTKPLLSIELTEHDLQRIYDLALSALKSGHNPAIDSHLQAVSCTLAAFEAWCASNAGSCISIKQPQPRKWESIDDE
jgi:hypothetical protein